MWDHAGPTTAIDCHIECNRQEGVLVSKNVPHFILRDCIVAHNNTFGISMEDHVSCDIRGCRVFENGFWGMIMKTKAAVNIIDNQIFHNSCGGVRIGFNYSSVIVLERNQVHHNKGPGIFSEVVDAKMASQFPHMFMSAMRAQRGPPNYGLRARVGIPPDEDCDVPFTATPRIRDNTEEHNRELLICPASVASPTLEQCCFCYQSRAVLACPDCHVIQYCTPECMQYHSHRHAPTCRLVCEHYRITVTAVRGGSVTIPHPGLPTKPKNALPPRVGVKFIVKVQTNEMDADPGSTLSLYDATRTLDVMFVDSTIFYLVLNYGRLGLNQFTSKKLYIWAVLTTARRDQVTLILDEFPRQPDTW